MFSQLLGNYLVNQGVIKKEVLTKILKEQNAARVKLGTIAVAEKLLTEEEANRINHLQTQMDMRFGDIAIHEGLLTEDQVSLLLKKQENSFMKFIQLLTEHANLSVSELEKHVLSFQHEKGFSDVELNALKKDDIDALLPAFAYASKPFVTNIIGLVLRNITRFITTDFYIDRINHVSSLTYSTMIGQKVSGQHSIYLGFASEATDDGLCFLASKFADSQITQINPEAADAIGEFSNINNGLFALSMSEKGVDLDMEPPFAYLNQTATGSAYVLPIHIEDKEISLYIAVDSDVSIGDTPYKYETEISEGSVISDGSKGSVVIVDDSKMIRKLLRNILETEGYCVVAEASNGLEAIDAYKKYHPDILSLDVTMPQMDGIEALEKIMEYDSHARVIMVTAAGQQQKVISALKLGAEKFIMKPFLKEDVIRGFEK